VNGWRKPDPRKMVNSHVVDRIHSCWPNGLSIDGPQAMAVTNPVSYGKRPDYLPWSCGSFATSLFSMRMRLVADKGCIAMNILFIVKSAGIEQ
jgi:hypothetical protein